VREGFYNSRPAASGRKGGFSENVRADIEPLWAIRHPGENGTSGWYIWRGEMSEDPSFFVPLHVDHLQDWCPDLLPYLALPPGHGVILAEDYEDVWFDSSYLHK
jgi:hypothetical protein